MLCEQKLLFWMRLIIYYIAYELCANDKYLCICALLQTLKDQKVGGGGKGITDVSFLTILCIINAIT